MSETILVARYPLEACTRTKGRERDGGPALLVVGEVRGRALINVIARKGMGDPLHAKVRDLFGLELPRKPRLAPGPEVSFLWAGHDQWLAYTDGDVVSDLPRTMQAAVGGLASVVDQSDARAWIRVSGASARAMLAKLAPIDLNPRAFKVFDTALTAMEHIGVQITQTDDVPSYEISVSRNFAESFWHGLIEAADEFGVSVAAPVAASADR